MHINVRYLQSPIHVQAKLLTIGDYHVDLMMFVAVSAGLNGAYLIAVSIAFVPSVNRFLKRKLRKDFSNWPWVATCSSTEQWDWRCMSHYWTL